MPKHNRSNRSHGGRDSETREAPWKPEPLLPVPDKKEGYEYRWVRARIRNENDDMNVSRALRQGWVPVKAEDHPELHVLKDIHSRFPENVEVGGLILCARDRRIGDANREKLSHMSDAQMEAVDRNYMRDSDPRMPMLKPSRRSNTERFGKGS